jgi:hypothetical protein
MLAFFAETFALLYSWVSDCRPFMIQFMISLFVLFPHRRRRRGRTHHLCHLVHARRQADRVAGHRRARAVSQHLCFVVFYPRTTDRKVGTGAIRASWLASELGGKNISLEGRAVLVSFHKAHQAGMSRPSEKERKDCVNHRGVENNLYNHASSEIARSSHHNLVPTRYAHEGAQTTETLAYDDSSRHLGAKP